ncbi:MAG: hypothetical protein AAF449_09520 [Myxococcota bacterium]
MLARVKLVQNHLEDIRVYMGVPSPPAPLIHVSEAQSREAFIQAANAFRRVQQLGFELLRIPQERIKKPDKNPEAVDILFIVNEALFRILQIKQSLRIELAVPEQLETSKTTPSDVFNAIVELGGLINSLLEKKTTPAVAFSATSLALHIARDIHAAKTSRFLPPPTEFVPSKRSKDAFIVMSDCLVLTRKLASKVGMEMLEFEIIESSRTVTADDVSELAALLITELVFLHEHLLDKESIAPFVLSSRKFPAHTFQRGKDLQRVLTSLIEATSSPTSLTQKNHEAKSK